MPFTRGAMGLVVKEPILDITGKLADAVSF